MDASARSRSASARGAASIASAASIISKYRVCIWSVIVTGGLATNATKRPKRSSASVTVVLGVLVGFHRRSEDTMPPDLRAGASRGAMSIRGGTCSAIAGGAGQICREAAPTRFTWFVLIISFPQNWTQRTGRDAPAKGFTTKVNGVYREDGAVY